MVKGLLFTIVCFLSVGTFAQDKQKDTCFVIPNSISKNSDDFLKIQSKCDLARFEFKLYSRWGNLLFETDQFSESIDIGLHEKLGKNKEQNKYQEGTYFYTIEYRRPYEGEAISLTGYIMIL
jgi:hypothetical protein